MRPVDGIDLPLPAFVQIEAVGEGNVGWPARERSPAFMTFEAFRELIAEFPALKELHFQGRRDPLLHPRLFDMVGLVAARGIAVSVTSTAAILGERRAEECAKSGLQRLDVALDTAPPAGCVARSLKRLAEAKARLGMREPIVRMLVPLTRDNLERLPEILGAARDARAASVVLRSLSHPSAKRMSRRQLELDAPGPQDAPRVTELLEAAQSRADELGIALEFDAEQHCERPWRAAYIGYSGEAAACERATNGASHLGNMRRDGVLAVWRGEPYQAFRERLASDEPPEICRGCALYRREGESYAANLSPAAPIASASTDFQSARKR
jgi:MoaA/NifB/PqqE/SkfB family radical SAM enzyme